MQCTNCECPEKSQRSILGTVLRAPGVETLAPETQGGKKEEVCCPHQGGPQEESQMEVPASIPAPAPTNHRWGTVQGAGWGWGGTASILCLPETSWSPSAPGSSFQGWSPFGPQIRASSLHDLFLGPDTSLNGCSPRCWRPSSFKQ